MQKGDMVMADQPDSRSRERIRSYGFVQEITKTDGVIIAMADGSLINRRFNSIAVYIHPPPNWQELYEQQIIRSPLKQSMMSRASYKKQNQN